jgi:L-cystine transport system permease protein
MILNLDFTVKAIAPILSAAPTTLLITVSAVGLGLFFGFFLALCRLYKLPALNRITQIYVSFVRGVPMIVMLYVVYYSMPSFIVSLNKAYGLGINIRNFPSMIYAIVTFTVYSTAHFSEMFRSAIGAVESRQMEAAYSVGLTGVQGMCRIILPQALVVALPNIANSFLGILKGSSLAVYVGVLEIMNRAKLEAADGFNYIEVYLVAAVIYWIISLFFEHVFKWMERKWEFENITWR